MTVSLLTLTRNRRPHLLNLMESLRHALMINRLTYDAASVSHLDTFRWASEGSARCLGRDDIGVIAAGKQADLGFYTLDELRFSGAGDPIFALIGRCP